MDKKKKDSPGALSDEARDAVLLALARKAAAGNITAARLFLEEYRAQHPGEAAPADYSALDAAFEQWAKGGNPA